MTDQRIDEVVAQAHAVLAEGEKMKILFIVNTAKESACRCAERAEEILTREGAICRHCAASAFGGPFAEQAEQLLQDCDLAITIGG